MPLSLNRLKLGKVDGKQEFLQPSVEGDNGAFDAFLVPDSVEPARLNNSDIYFIDGFRGTGKTSLLRWHAEEKRKLGNVTEFILFKSDLTEEQRQQISNEVGIEWLDPDSTKMGIAQDFKSSWTWFILHKIGEILVRRFDHFEDDQKEAVSRVIRLLDLQGDSIFQKIIGFLPKIEGSSVKIKADLPFFEAELGGDFKKDGALGRATLDALNRKIKQEMSKIRLKVPVWIYFDELEAFYHTPEQHKRDMSMVRDLLFSIAASNQFFRSVKLDIHAIGAVRSEVVDAMGALGQEVDRVVYDNGFQISWHHTRKSVTHPLIEIVRRKIWISEDAIGEERSVDPIATYFPTTVDNRSIETFLLDKSFYKPRDVVWRLTLAQRLFPYEEEFSERVLHDTEIEYSSKLWDEVAYELSATYSEDEIDGIESLFAGKSPLFDLGEIEVRWEASKKAYPAIGRLEGRKGSVDVLNDLYRLGAIGNSYRAGASGSDFKQRWHFRGDTKLLHDKRMVVHPALDKRLSVVFPRKRGPRPDGPTF